MGVYDINRLVLHGNATGFVLYRCSFYDNMFVVRRPPAVLLTAVIRTIRRPYNDKYDANSKSLPDNGVARRA